MPDASPVEPSVAAALLLMLRELAPELGQFPQTKGEVLALAGAYDESEVFEILERLRKELPALLEPLEPMEGARHAIEGYHKCDDSPATIIGPDGRTIYTDDFLGFVMSLAAPGEPGRGLSTSELACVSGVPIAVLNDWLRRNSSTS